MLVKCLKISPFWQDGTSDAHKQNNFPQKKNYKVIFVRQFLETVVTLVRFLSRQVIFLPGIGCIYAFKSLEKIYGKAASFSVTLV